MHFYFFGFGRGFGGRIEMMLVYSADGEGFWTLVQLTLFFEFNTFFLLLVPLFSFLRVFLKLGCLLFLFFFFFLKNK